jgi:limonene-1,2-epoxide hydrolase
VTTSNASRGGAAHEEVTMDIDRFMQGYQRAWEGRDEQLFCALFAPDGEYHNTPFAVQRGPAELAAYWQRVKLQEDVRLRYDILSRSAQGGIAHWHVTYQVASEELFRIWAASTGTNLVARRPDEPLPRMVLDGVLQAEFADGLCTCCRLWWHSMPEPAAPPA